MLKEFSLPFKIMKTNTIIIDDICDVWGEEYNSNLLVSKKFHPFIDLKPVTFDKKVGMNLTY